jgi:hypothetical protein
MKVSQQQQLVPGVMLSNEQQPDSNSWLVSAVMDGMCLTAVHMHTIN